MKPTCHCPFCGCQIVARLDSYGTAQAYWQKCPHLRGFERLEGKLHARFTEETDAAKRNREPSGAAGTVQQPV
jgi:hypothetical protein